MKVYTSSGVYDIKEHRVKILPSYFEAQVNNSKNFEIRKNDRNYQVGDLLLLEEYNPTTSNYTGQDERFIAWSHTRPLLSKYQDMLF